MKVVKFIKPHLMYQKGETAGFDETLAKALIDAGKAVDPAAPLPVAPVPEPLADSEPENAAEPDAEPEPDSSDDTGASDPGAPPAQGKRRK